MDTPCTAWQALRVIQNRAGGLGYWGLTRPGQGETAHRASPAATGLWGTDNPDPAGHRGGVKGEESKGRSRAASEGV